MSHKKIDQPSPIYEVPDFMSKSKEEQIKILQECYANASATFYRCLGHNKTDQAKNARNLWEKMLIQRGAKADPDLEGRMNGKGSFRNF